jgi:hypothetical protein
MGQVTLRVEPAHQNHRQAQEEQVMDSALAVVLGATVGALSGLLGQTLAGFWQWRIQREKWSRDHDEHRACLVVDITKELSTQLGSVLLLMCWVTWKAKKGGPRLTQADVDKYDAEMYAMLPKANGSLAVLATLDSVLTAAFDAIVNDVFVTDEAIGTAGLSFDADRPGSEAGIANLYDTVYRMQRDLPKRIAETVRSGGSSG